MASIALRNIRCIDYLAYVSIFTRATFRPKIKLDVFFPPKKTKYSPGGGGSLGRRNLTDSPPHSINTGVYVGIHISQGKIHHVPCVVALRKTEKKMRRGQIFVFIADLNRSRSAEKECQLSLLEQTKLTELKMTKVY